MKNVNGNLGLRCRHAFDAFEEVGSYECPFRDNRIIIHLNFLPDEVNGKNYMYAVNVLKIYRL